MSSKLEQRLLRQGLVDLRLLRRKRESDSRCDVVGHYGELLLSFSLGRERARRCERGLFRLPLHARARVDHEHGAEPLGAALADRCDGHQAADRDRKSTRLNSSHMSISYAVFCLKKKK